ncbi:hypothetical protein IMSAGC006_01067 [Muribaculaceae bacterium]|nr:hypothetical protein IMSAGC006_01067 [Muribaculaceae bacterium]
MSASPIKSKEEWQLLTKIGKILLNERERLKSRRIQEREDVLLPKKATNTPF